MFGQTPTTDFTTSMLQRFVGSGSMTGAASSIVTPVAPTLSADGGARKFPWLLLLGFGAVAFLVMKPRR